MIRFLKIFFIIVLLSMLAVTGWASGQCALWKTPRPVATHPWFIATLADAYWGFITFYCWVCYKEISWVRRLLWLVAILLLGNIAMSAYVLNKLFRLPEDATAGDLLASRA
jgi:hypothetical protein